MKGFSTQDAHLPTRPLPPTKGVSKVKPLPIESREHGVDTHSHQVEDALQHGVSPEFSTYHLHPGFIRDLQEGDEMINGWNDHLEAWLMDIQKDANTYYCILVETARFLTLWKWIWIAVNILVTAAAVITTTIALALGKLLTKRGFKGALTPF
jgi:hypothetical protein